MKRFIINAKAAYIVVPKAASRSFIHFFKEGENSAIMNSPFCPSPATTFFNRKFLYGCENKFKFTFVRNPLSRLVSAYNDKIFLPDYAKHLNKIDPRFKFGMNFEDFADIVYDIPDSNSDQHIISQHLLIYDAGRPLFNFVGRVENIESDFKIVCQQVNATYLLPRLNKAPKKVNYLDFYSEKLMQKMKQKYRKDFELFYPEEL